LLDESAGKDEWAAWAEMLDVVESEARQMSLSLQVLPAFVGSACRAVSGSHESDPGISIFACCSSCLMVANRNSVYRFEMFGHSGKGGL
jgi:hypothetical protein